MLAACGRCVPEPCVPGAEAVRAGVSSGSRADLQPGAAQQPGGHQRALCACEELGKEGMVALDAGVAWETRVIAV